jgi:hypothetical protein
MAESYPVAMYTPLGRCARPFAVGPAMPTVERTMFVLEGGPRDGALVDELPAGYQPCPPPGAEIELFDGYIAHRSMWAGADQD